MFWISLAYQTTCFKFEEMTWRLTEYEGRGPESEGRINLIAKKQNTDITSKCRWDFIVLLCDLYICKMAKKLSCLNNKITKYWPIYAIEPLSKNNLKIEYFFSFNISESYYNLFLNPLNPFSFRKAFLTLTQIWKQQIPNILQNELFYTIAVGTVWSF